MSNLEKFKDIAARAGDHLLSRYVNRVFQLDDIDPDNIKIDYLLGHSGDFDDEKDLFYGTIPALLLATCPPLGIYLVLVTSFSLIRDKLEQYERESDRKSSRSEGGSNGSLSSQSSSGSVESTESKVTVNMKSSSSTESSEAAGRKKDYKYLGNFIYADLFKSKPEYDKIINERWKNKKLGEQFLSNALSVCKIGSLVLAGTMFYTVSALVMVGIKFYNFSKDLFDGMLRQDNSAGESAERRGAE